MKREGVVYIMRRLGVQMSSVRAKKNIQICCPLAKYRRGHVNGTDSHPSMGVSLSDVSDSVAHCFTCKWRGKLSDLVDELRRYGEIGDEDAMQLNDYIVGMEEVPLEDLVDSIGGYDVRAESIEDEVFDEALLADYKGKTNRYMVDRGIAIPTLQRWEGGFDSSKKRVIFPVRNWRGHLVGAVGRGVHEGMEPVYDNYWNFQKGRYLYGENKVVRDTTLVVVEGPMDVLSVWQQLDREGLLGRYSVVGLFGSEASAMQVRKIVQLADDVLLFFDNDLAGWVGQQRLGKALQRQIPVRTVQYQNPEGGDPDELVRSGIPILDTLENSQLFFEEEENEYEYKRTKVS